MEETATPASILMPAGPKVAAAKSPRSPSVPRSWIPRPAYVAITFALLLTIGWGAFSIIGRQSPADEDAELADLENFEEESPSLGAPDSQFQPSSESSSSRNLAARSHGERPNPWQTPPIPGSSEPPVLFAAPDNSTAGFERPSFGANRAEQSRSGAWLVGTIEAVEAPERIALPPRVSQAVADGPLFR